MRNNDKQIQDEFMHFCTEEQLNEFVHSLETYARFKGRLRLVHERLWSEFSKTTELPVPEDIAIIGRIFGVGIPRKRLTWNELDNDSIYVADLVETPDGVRYLCPRCINDQIHPDTRFTTIASKGLDLIRLQACDAIILLETGEKVVVNAHGAWRVV